MLTPQMRLSHNLHYCHFYCACVVDFHYINAFCLNPNFQDFRVFRIGRIYEFAL